MQLKKWIETTVLKIRSKAINKEVKKWLEANKSRKAPAFIFVNYIDAHHPYLPPEKYRPPPPEGVNKPKVMRVNRNPMFFFTGEEKLNEKEMEYLRSLYYASVEHEDHIINELIDTLDSYGFMKDAVVIVTADHGEYLGEHDQLCHLFGVHEPVIKIPFIIYAPGRVPEGVRYGGNVQSVDVPPTLLEIIGLRYSSAGKFQGKALMKYIDGDTPVRKYSISELMNPKIPLRMLKRAKKNDQARYMLWETRQRTITEDRRQLEVHSNGFTRLWLLNETDVDATDVTTSEASLVKPMRATLEKWLGSFEHARPEGEAPEMSPEVKAKLKALGYIE